jgi:hypothetical protein
VKKKTMEPHNLKGKRMINSMAAIILANPVINDETTRIAMAPSTPISLYIATLLPPIIGLAVISFVLFLLAKFVFSTCREQKLIRIELSKIAEEIKQSRIKKDTTGL